jgi:penicillin-binding protein 1B
MDLHYDKAEILEAYLNEIYLGQDRNRAIHGFGLASRFYFDKPVSDLGLNEIATLVALIRGPSYYHPDRHPQRLRQRRDRILDQLVEQEVVTGVDASAVKTKPITVIRDRNTSTAAHPAFIDLVKRQLREYYRESDLTSEGLKIFTTMSPLLQKQVEQVVSQRVLQLDRQRQLHGELQAAAIIANVTSGEVLALVGDRNPRFAGFNRALDAARPIGSLMKPVVYLSALRQKDKYNWLSSIADESLNLQAKDGSTWSPKNYDGEFHGNVSLITALTQSYNLATVRLGLDVGFPAINDSLKRLGIKHDIPPYPAILLGATELTPFETAQMYQTLAANGFRSSLRAIREVLDAGGQPLRRYPIQVEQALDSDLVQTLNSGLIQVIERGTASRIRGRLPKDMFYAGKTGTTNDTRDSWFAGYSAAHLGVVWLGTDDNQPTGLTGSSGALSLWGEIFDKLTTSGLSFDESGELELLWVDPVAMKRSGRECDNAILLAFLPGTAPQESVGCAKNTDGVNKTINWFKNLFR